MRLKHPSIILYWLIPCLIIFSLASTHAQEDIDNPQLGMVAVDSAGFEMVYVPTGIFEIGIEREKFVELLEQGVFGDVPESQFPFIIEEYEQQGVFNTIETLTPAFWLDRFEVTIEQYQTHAERCVATGQCATIDLDEFPHLTANPTQPQVDVNWFDALRFCLGRGSRLPTEIEWEYAARGTRGYLFPWGDNLLYEYVASANNLMTTYPVGSRLDNVSWVGAFDMVGNAGEWVDGRLVPYALTPDGIATWNKPPELDTFRVVRGGSYSTTALFTTTIARRSAQPQSGGDIGIRCARSTDPRE